MLSSTSLFLSCPGYSVCDERGISSSGGLHHFDWTVRCTSAPNTLQCSRPYAEAFGKFTLCSDDVGIRLVCQYGAHLVCKSSSRPTSSISSELQRKASGDKSDQTVMELFHLAGSLRDDFIE